MYIKNIIGEIILNLYVKLKFIQAIEKIHLFQGRIICISKNNTNFVFSYKYNNLQKYSLHLYVA